MSYHQLILIILNIISSIVIGGNVILDKKNISKFIPFVKYFIFITLIFTVFILLGTIKVMTEAEVSYELMTLSSYIVFFIVVIIGFCLILNKGYKLIKKYIRNLNKINIDDIDMAYNIRNQANFIKESEALIKRNMKNKYALVHYDVNKFTIINNTVGYEAGDEILKQIGKTLRENLINEIIGKAEGDKFFVLFAYEKEEEIIERTCYISRRIENIKIWKKMRINPVIKAGIYYVDNNNLDIRTAIDKAYFAKDSFRNSYKSDYGIYDCNLEIGLIEISRIEDEMQAALENNEFKVYLQPKVNLNTGEISGAEALVRWEHPELGLLSPNKFIPIFEKNGFIVKLDMYVFEQVCIYLRKWVDLGYDVVPISVNVSRVHFLNNGFVSDYSKIKEKHHVENNLIEVEITESVVFDNENEDEVFKVMREFKDAGFEISMDDFGSGYSSLGLLKEMPIDTLKLDRVLIKNIEDDNSQIIVSNVINMVKSLNLKVVSEGVETHKQVDFLRGIGCDMAQGYVFAKPESVENYEKLIKLGKINYYNLAV